MRRFVRVLSILVLLGGIGGAAHFFMQLADLEGVLRQYSEEDSTDHAKEASGHESASSEGHGESAGGHGESEEKGGGIGEALMIGVGELLVNVRAKYPDTHYLRVEMDLEPFEVEHRWIIMKNRTGIKNTVIELLREQDHASLKTLSGKLYFKEALAARINTYLRVPAVRKVHFSSFYLQ